MIISAPRKALIGNKIALEKWLLPSLYLNNSNTYFYIYDKSNNNDHYMEMIVTSIDPRYWPDCWRIDFITKDKPGNLKQIFRIFDALDIRVLQSEGSVRTFGKHHEMCFICSLDQYETINDLNTIQRYGHDYLKLKDLDAFIKVNLGDQIYLPDSNAPALKIRRLHYHREMHQDIVHRKIQTLDYLTSGEMKDGNINLTRHFSTELKNQFGEDVEYTPLVDTKNRVLRILFFQNTRSGIYYIQVLFHEGDSELISKTFEKIWSHHGNILRYQIRPCPKDTANKCFGIKKRAQVSKLDITFDFSGTKGTQSAQATYKKIICAINSIDGTKLKVSKSHE